MEWWITEIGDNMLKGVEEDPLNPYRLHDWQIVDFFRRIPDSRSSYQRLRSGLLEEEQVRIDALLRSAGVELFLSPEEKTERFQAKMNANTTGVHTTGPGGGNP